VQQFLKWLFFAAVVKPVVLFVLGLNVRNRARLPSRGPAIIAANHNSHLDALVLMSLLSRKALLSTRPVAAADYFLANRWRAAFTMGVLGILPIRRGSHPGLMPSSDAAYDVLASCEAALRRGEILIVFPEGTRGEPEQMAQIKSGVTRLLERVPDTALVPVFTHGLGKTLPRGAWLPVPFTCDVFVGAPIRWPGDRLSAMSALKTAFSDLRAEGQFPEWT
jgi:1-acyl-sn-glycerol-3-phosphate acyltransferase